MLLRILESDLFIKGIILFKHNLSIGSITVLSSSVILGQKIDYLDLKWLFACLF